MNKLEQMLLLKAIKESNLMPQTKSFMDVVLKNWKNAKPAGSAKVSSPSAPPEIESFEPSEFDSVDQISSPEPVAVSSPEVASGTSRIADQLRSAGGEGGTAMSEAEGVQAEPAVPKVEPFKTPREKEAALGDIYKRRAYLQHLIMSKGSMQGSMLSPEQEAEFERFFPGVSPYGTSPQKLQALYDQLEPQIAELQARPVQGGLRGAMARIGQFVNPPMGLRPFSSEEEARRYISGDYLADAEGSSSDLGVGSGQLGITEEEELPTDPNDPLFGEEAKRWQETRVRIEELRASADKRRSKSRNANVRRARAEANAYPEEGVHTISGRRAGIEDMMHKYDPDNFRTGLRGATTSSPFTFELPEDKERAELMMSQYMERMAQEQREMSRQLSKLRAQRARDNQGLRPGERHYPASREELALEQKLNNALAENRKYQKRLALIQRARVTEELID